MPCGEWHAAWQELFATAGADVETEFLPLEGSHSRRVADVCISSHNTVLELQHSLISGAEVRRRNHDYRLHGLRPYWLIDGNDGIDVFPLGEDDVLLDFADIWKYNSFLSEPVVFVERQCIVYAFHPSLVKYGTTVVRAGTPIRAFVDAGIAEGPNAATAAGQEELPPPPPQHTLYVQQEGAGNGKTFSAVQRSANDPRFAHKTVFLYLIKTHPAKEVIMQEFANQLKCNLLEIEEATDQVEGVGKQYKITFRRADNGEEVVILAGTIDSFVWALGRGADVTPGVNMFQAYCQAIAGGHAVYHNAFGSIRYAGTCVRLNQRCIVIVDEAQDLGRCYLDALAAVVRRTNIDVQLVGDKLQSIWGFDNMFAQAAEFATGANIHVVFNEPKNVCRRFHTWQLAAMVNDVVRFQQYDAPPISAICDGGPQCKHRHVHEDPAQRVEVVLQPSMRNRGAKQAFIDGILRHMDALVDAHGYVPESFMFVFPFMKGNEMAVALVEMLQEYWEAKFKDPGYRRDVLDAHPYWRTDDARADVFRLYAYLHRSEEGRPIDMTVSERATRLVSIHSAKGDGRERVYVLNLRQSALERFTDGETNGQYESLLHVALTRAKEGIVVGVCDADDDIGRRFAKYMAGSGSLLQCASLYAGSSTVSAQRLSGASLPKGEDWPQRLHAAYFAEVDPGRSETKEEARDDCDCDSTHAHVMRYNLLVSANQYVTTATGVPPTANAGIVANLMKVARAGVVSCNARRYREALDEISEGLRSKDSQQPSANLMPTLRFGHDSSGAYAKYHDRLVETLEDVQKALRASLPYRLPDFGPLQTCMVVHAMEVLDNGAYANFPAMDLYEILHSFESTSGRASLAPSHSLAQRVGRQFARAMKNLSGPANAVGISEFLPSYPVAYYGNTDDFKIFTSIPLVAVAPEDVVLFYTRPSVNQLNRQDVLMAVLWDTFIVKNTGEGIGKDKRPHKRFGGKRVHACVITLDDAEPMWLRLLDDTASGGSDRLFREYAVRVMFEEQRPRALWSMFEKELAAHGGDLPRTFKAVCEQLDKNPYARTLFERAQKATSALDERVLTEYIEDDLRMWLDIDDDNDRPV